MADNDSAGGFGWFLAGLGIGALVGVLYAPKSGKETRDDLKAGAMEAKDRANELYEQGKTQAAAYAEQGKQVASQYVDKSKQMAAEYVDKGKEYYDKGRTPVVAVCGQGQGPDPDAGRGGEGCGRRGQGSVRGEDERDDAGCLAHWLELMRVKACCDEGR